MCNEWAQTQFLRQEYLISNTKDLHISSSEKGVDDGVSVCVACLFVFVFVSGVAEWVAYVNKFVFMYMCIVHACDSLRMFCLYNIHVYTYVYSCTVVFMQPWFEEPPLVGTACLHRKSAWAA